MQLSLNRAVRLAIRGQTPVRFNLYNKKSIVPEIGTLNTFTASQRLVQTASTLFFETPTNGAAKLNARPVYNRLAGKCSSENIQDGQWTTANSATITGTTTFTTGATNSYIKTPDLGINPIAGDVIVMRARVKTSSATAKIRFVLSETGAGDTTADYESIATGITEIEFSQTITALGGGSAEILWIQCDTSGVIVTVTNIAAYVTNHMGDITGYCPEYISAGVLSSPYHRAGVDGLKWFDTALANTVDANGLVTDAIGASLSNLYGEEYWPSKSSALPTGLERTWSSWQNNWAGGVTLTTGYSGITGGLTSARLTSIDNTSDGFNASISLTAASAYNIAVVIASGTSEKTRIQLFDNTAGSALAYIDVTWTGTVPSEAAGGSGYSNLEIVYLCTIDGLVYYRISADITTVNTDHALIILPVRSGTITTYIHIDWAQITSGAGFYGFVQANTTRSITTHGIVWPTGLVNNFKIKFKVYVNKLDTVYYRRILSVGTSTDYLDVNIALSGKLECSVNISSTLYTVIANNAMSELTQYDVEIIYNGGMSMIIDEVTQADTDAVSSDMGWSDPEVMYLAQRYDVNGVYSGACAIADVEIIKL